MSKASSIMIAAPSTAVDRADRLLESLACAEWPDGGPASVTVSILDAPATAAERAIACDALVLVHEPDPDAALAALVDRASVDGVPIVHVGGSLALGPGMLRLCETSPPESIVAALAGLLARSADVERLQLEITIAQRVADGVHAEITRLDEELQMAALLQQEFLPRLPITVDGLSFAALWRPASSVSGDIFDFFRLDAWHVGIFLADAVGHGVPAALQAMMLCRSLETHDRADLLQRPLSPSEALSRLNDVMVDRQGSVGRYAAAIYAVLDCRTRTVRIANGGSPPPVVIGPDQTRVLDATGALLGIVPGQIYDEVEVRLAPGETLCFHSDGLEAVFPTEAAIEGAVSLPRHIETLNALRDAGRPEDAIRLLGSILDHERGSLHQRDDCTLVLAHAVALPWIQAEAA